MTKIIERIETIISFVITYTVLLVVLIGVAWRYMFNMPVIWVEEVANMLYVWIVFLGAAMTFREGTMVKMDFLYDVFPKPVQQVIHILFNMIIVTASVLLIPKAYSFLVKISKVDTMVLKISWAYLFWPGLFIVVAMAVIGSMKMIKDINQLRR